MTYFTMGRNKIIIIIVFATCLGLLSWFIYNTFFDKKEAIEKSTQNEFNFEVPQVDKKKEKRKIEHYQDKLDQDSIFKKKMDMFLDIEGQDESAIEESDSYYYADSLSNHLDEDFMIQDTIQNEEEIEDYLTKLMDSIDQNYGFGTLGNDTIKYSVSDQKNDTSLDLEGFDDIKLKDDETLSFFHNAKIASEHFNKAMDHRSPRDSFMFKAELYMDQTLENGKLVKIHLLENLEYEDVYLPKNTVLFGFANMAPNRVFIKVTPKASNGERLGFGLFVHDFDGNEGIFIENNSITNIPVETAEELTELVQQSYKQNSSFQGGQRQVDLKTSAGIIGSTKILKYLNRQKVHIAAGYRLWLIIKSKT